MTNYQYESMYNFSGTQCQSVKDKKIVFFVPETQTEVSRALSLAHAKIKPHTHK